MPEIARALTADEPIHIPMSAAHWRVLPADSMGPNAQLSFVSKEGFPEGLLIVKAGTVALNGYSFRDGIIEFDMKALSPDMPGIQFRNSGPGSADNGEEVYLRLFGDCRASNDCIQYAPVINGFMLWNVYPQYQHQAFVLDGWNHVKLIISGQRMNVYLNGQSQPSLSVGELESHSQTGAIRLRGPAVFANLTITPGVVEGLPATAAPDPTAGDLRFVRHWQVSALQSLPRSPAPSIAMMPRQPAAWRAVDSDRGGLLNLNRQYTLQDSAPSLEWLRFTIDAQQAGTRRVSLGWLGHVWVFTNGQLITDGKNFYDPERERRQPDGRLSLENGSFQIPLKKGRNEVALALFASGHDDLTRKNYYGWGLLMRFDDMRGVTFVPWIG